MNIKLNDNISIDLDKLIASKLLIQANSGGGKSWLIRRLVEQAYGKVQIIILDPEGEFSTLREKFDFVLAGVGGDTPAESRSASLLALKLLELKVSTIIDLYELPPQERKHFVRLFFDAMVNAPKDLYHDVLVVLDEAHMFVPEKDQSEAASAVIDMASRGRKRGYSLVLATQRISKLNKDAAAECNTKLIGRTSLDIDRKRAADELGIFVKEDVLALRSLKPGEFFAFGPAISDEVIKVTVGDVQTSVPKAGRQFKVVPPTEGIKKILGKLADLPKEAEKELRTVAELKSEITRLKRDASRRPLTKAPAQEIKKIEVPVIGQKALAQIMGYEKVMRKMVKDFRESTAGANSAADLIEISINKLMDKISKTIPAPEIKSSSIRFPFSPAKKQPIQITFPRPTPPEKFEVAEAITNPEQRILNAIAWMEAIGVASPERPAVAFLSGYSNTRSTGFTNPCGSLRARGLIDYPSGDTIKLTTDGREIAHYPNITPTTAELQRTVLDKLPNPERRLLSILLERYPVPISNPELAACAGYSNDRSTGYTNPRGRLRTLGLIEYVQGQVKARDILFI